MLHEAAALVIYFKMTPILNLSVLTGIIIR